MIKSLLLLTLLSSILFADVSFNSAAPVQKKKSKSTIKVEFTPIAGGLFSAPLYTSQEELHLHGGGQFGGILGIKVPNNLTLELSYMWAESDADGEYWDNAAQGYITVYEKVQQQVFQVGARKDMYTTGPLTLFTVGTIGLTWFRAPAIEASDLVAFSFTAGGGALIMIAKHFGFRADARYQMPIFSSSGGFYFNGNGGTAVIHAGSVIPQLGLYGGLVLAF